MTGEIWRKIKAILLIAIVAGAEVSHVQQEARVRTSRQFRLRSSSARGTQAKSGGKQTSDDMVDKLVGKLFDKSFEGATQSSSDHLDLVSILVNKLFSEAMRKAPPCKMSDAQNSTDDLLGNLVDKLFSGAIKAPGLHQDDLDHKEQGTEQVSEAQISMDDLVDKLVHGSVDKLFGTPIQGKVANPKTRLGFGGRHALHKNAFAMQRRPTDRVSVASSPKPRMALVLPQSSLRSPAAGQTSGLQPGAATLMAGLARHVQLRNRCTVQAGAAAGDAGAIKKSSTLADLASLFCNLFAVWLAITAVAALKVPATFTWIPGDAFTYLLGLLMFSVGITTSVDDFKRCLTRPGAVAVNFFSCYAIMPALAYAIGKIMGADGPILAGLVLVGAINGGQASNLCTLIAGGDVALSVLMTTCCTLGCIVMTPLICKLVLGAVVPVNAVGIVISTIQVVLAPIFLGVGLNTVVPSFSKAVSPFTPVIGVIVTVLLVGASVAKCAGTIIEAGWPLQIGLLIFHLVGGLLGYGFTALAKFDEKTRRTVAIETAMKSSAFAFLLASQHFGHPNVMVPPAVSVVWMAIIGSVLAVYWKSVPTSDSEKRDKWFCTKER